MDRIRTGFMGENIDYASGEECVSDGNQDCPLALGARGWV